MIGSFLTRGLVMVLGYTYPAYECFKTVEKNKPEIEQLRFWCQYWILVAVMTVLERIGDTFISWVPMYSEAKLAFFVYLWYPKTRGTAYVYDTFLKPYVAKHETEIDRNLLELKAKAGDIAVLYWQRAASYGHTRIFEIMRFAASQSPRPHPAQQQHAGVRRPPQAAMAHKTPPPQQPQCPPATATAGQQDKPAQETGPSSAPPAASPAQAQPQVQATAPVPPTTEAPSQSTVPSEEQLTETKPVPVPENEGVDPPPQEVVMEKAIRVTCGRLRKTRAATSR